jgi:hypothetical protein
MGYLYMLERRGRGFYTSKRGWVTSRHLKHDRQSGIKRVDLKRLMKIRRCRPLHERNRSQRCCMHNLGLVQRRGPLDSNAGEYKKVACPVTRQG